MFTTPLANSIKQEQNRNMRSQSFKVTPLLLFCGSIAAGWPSPAEEITSELLSFDEWLGTNRTDTFLLNVTTDAMDAVGIQKNDLVIIQRGKEPNNGDIVIAQVDNNWVIRFFQLSKTTTALLPANPHYSKITLSYSNFSIIGVVTAVVRKYH